MALLRKQPRRNLWTQWHKLSRASIIVMLSAYIAYLVFQLWTHRQLFEAEFFCRLLINVEYEGKSLDGKERA
uniref:Uncharacterized protein n=1 Tax=Cucumis melo TaxID=3656 RepID=A0A9I9E2R9_CUCME